MGFNTTVVIMNDALGEIAKDPNFGKNLAAAVSECGGRNHRVDVCAGNHGNAAHVVESHHADSTCIVTVGGNLGIKQLESFGWNHHEQEGQLELLLAWSSKMGFSLKPATPEAKALMDGLGRGSRRKPGVRS